MKKKILFPLFGLAALALSSGAIIAARQSEAVQANADGVSAKPGDAPIGEEADWAPVADVADINTSDFYMIRATYNDAYQYSTGTMDFVNGVALYTDVFANARMFKFIKGTNGYKVTGLFDVADELENCHYLDIYHEGEEAGLWATDTEADAAEFEFYADGAKIMLREYGQTYMFGALGVKWGDHAGQTMILNMDPETYAYYSASLLPLELVSIAAPADPEADALTFATSFTEDLADVCANENADNSAGVSAKWAAHKEAFEALSAEAKTRFAESEDAMIAQARALYEHCVARYGLDAWEDAPEVQANYQLLHGGAKVSGTNVAVVLCASLLTVSALAMILVIKKKKHN